MQHAPEGNALRFVFTHVANVLAVSGNGFQRKKVGDTHDYLHGGGHQQHQPKKRLGNRKPCPCQHDGAQRVGQHAARIVQHKGVGFTLFGLWNHQALAARAGDMVKPNAHTPFLAVQHQAPGSVRGKAVAR